MSVGALGFIAVGIESSALTNSVAVAAHVPITGETLAVTKADLESQGIAAQWDAYGGMYNGIQRVGGNVTMDVHPIQIGYFLRSFFDATSTSVGCATASDWFNLVDSDADYMVHQFVAKQDQFQAGSGSDVPTLTILAYRGPDMTASSAFAYYNCAANGMELTVEAGALQRASFDFIGREYGRAPRGTPSFPAPSAFLWSQASLSLNGAGSSIFESVTVRGNNAMTDVIKIRPNLRADVTKRDGFRTFELSGTISFEDDTDYDRFTAGTEIPLVVHFTAGSNQLRIEAPAFRYSTFQPNISGPGRISIPFTGRAMRHVGSGTALQVTLVNTRTDDYTINS